MAGVILTVALATHPGCVAKGGTQENGGAGPLQEAESLYFNLRLDDAREAFLRAFEASSATNEQKAEAARNLATIEWRFHDSPLDAETWLGRAEELEPGSFETLAERIRVLEHIGATDAALEVAERARTAATTLEQRTRATTSFARVALAALQNDAEPHEAGDGKDGVARVALGRLNELIAEQRGWLEPSRLALELALRLDDGRSAFTAWHSYHWTPSDGPNNPLLAGPAAIFDRELPRWAGPESSDRSRLAVVDALAASGFYREAAWVATDPRAPAAQRVDDDPRAVETIAYSRFLEALVGDADDYYRRRAIGDIGHGELERAFREHGRALWQELPWPGAPPSFTSHALETELSERFGVEIMWGQRSDAVAMHYGHRMLDDERDIEQYGRTASMRFVVLDAMASNGYTTWFWDGRAATGGWVNDDGTIVQVREPYAEDPLEAWLQMTHVADREKLDAEIAAKTAADDAIARANPHAYLPGLALRLRSQVFEGILEELKNRGRAGAELQAAFLAEVDTRSRASSIFAHEGRHALDRTDLPAQWLRSDADREYRAKLSEVAFAPEPRLALIGGILSANIGGDSSHGQANERVMRGLVSWMLANAGEIEGLDAARPYLPQLDLLTDEQLREAVRSMDPWATG